MRHIERIHKVQFVAFQKERDRLTEEQAQRKLAEAKYWKEPQKRMYNRRYRDGEEVHNEVKGTDKALLKYFHPLDDEGYRKCKLCDHIPDDRRRSAGKVVSHQ